MAAKIESGLNYLNAAVVALIAVTGWRIGRATLAKPWQWYVAVLSGLALAAAGAAAVPLRFRPNPFLVMVGAAALRFTFSPLWF